MKPKNNYCDIQENCKLLNEAYRQSVKYKLALDEIKTELNILHFSAIPYHRGLTHDLADIIDSRINKILDIINKAKEGKNER